MRLAQMVIGHPDRREAGVGKLLDDLLVGFVKGNDSTGRCESLEWIKVFVFQFRVDPNLGPTTGDDLDVISPIWRQDRRSTAPSRLA